MGNPRQGRTLSPEASADRNARKVPTSALQRRMSNTPYSQEDLDAGSDVHIRALMINLAEPEALLELKPRDRWFLSALLAREQYRRTRIKEDIQDKVLRIPNKIDLRSL